jgi:hypothetical protein
MLFFKKKEEIKQVEKKFEIVSLGVNCLPRTLLTRKNLKPRKAQGELSCPFDLVSHEPERITHYIENDFAGYFDDLSFRVRSKGWWDFRKKGLWEKSDNTQFFHDKDCKINDREKLVNRVSKRMDNFRKILENEKPIIFVQSLKHTEDIENLYSVLKKKRGNKPFKLAILDFNDVVKKEYDDIYIFKIPYPNIQKYEVYWNKKRNYDSKEGRAFEDAVKISIEKVISEL